MLPFFLTANADAHASPGSLDAFSMFPVYSGRMGACVVPQALMNGEDVFFVHDINPPDRPASRAISNRLQLLWHWIIIKSLPPSYPKLIYLVVLYLSNSDVCSPERDRRLFDSTCPKMSVREAARS